VQVVCTVRALLCLTPTCACTAYFGLCFMIMQPWRTAQTQVVALCPVQVTAYRTGRSCRRCHLAAEKVFDRGVFRRSSASGCLVVAKSSYIRFGAEFLANGLTGSILPVQPHPEDRDLFHHPQQFADDFTSSKPSLMSTSSSAAEFPPLRCAAQWPASRTCAASQVGCFNSVGWYERSRWRLRGLGADLCCSMRAVFRL
jgi:hypothetical protein